MYKFPNGYGASVIETYYIEEDCIEIAVVYFDDEGNYQQITAPITDDVIVVTDIEEQDNVLQRILI